jgi:hypothetical protein
MNRNVVELVNRTDKDFSFMFDGVGYTVPANKSLDVTEDAARHAYKKSIMAYDLETGRATYQVGIKGIHPTSTLGSGKDATDELIDRETDIQGKPAKINVRGGQVAPTREMDALAGEGV